MPVPARARASTCPCRRGPERPRSGRFGPRSHNLLCIPGLGRIASTASTTRQMAACRRGSRRGRSRRQYGAATATSSLTCRVGWNLAWMRESRNGRSAGDGRRCVRWRQVQASLDSLRRRRAVAWEASGPSMSKRCQGARVPTRDNSTRAGQGVHPHRQGSIGRMWTADAPLVPAGRLDGARVQTPTTATHTAALSQPSLQAHGPS